MFDGNGLFWVKKRISIKRQQEKLSGGSSSGGKRREPGKGHFHKKDYFEVRDRFSPSFKAFLSSQAMTYFRAPSGPILVEIGFFR